MHKIVLAATLVVALIAVGGWMGSTEATVDARGDTLVDIFALQSSAKDLPVTVIQDLI